MANTLGRKFVDCYKVLGLQPNCSDLEIKNKFAFLAKQLHPDSGSASQCREKFQAVTEAYRQLTADRRAYDQLHKLHHAGKNHFSDFGFDSSNDCHQGKKSAKDFFYEGNSFWSRFHENRVWFKGDRVFWKPRASRRGPSVWRDLGEDSVEEEEDDEEFFERDWAFPRKTPPWFQGQERCRATRTGSKRTSTGPGSRQHKYHTGERDEYTSRSKTGGVGVGSNAGTSHQSSEAKERESGSEHTGYSASGKDRVRSRRETRGPHGSHASSFVRETNFNWKAGAAGCGRASREEDNQFGLHAAKTSRKKVTRARTGRVPGDFKPGGAVRRWQSWREVDVCVVEEDSSDDGASQKRGDSHRPCQGQRHANRRSKGRAGEVHLVRAAKVQKQLDVERGRKPDRKGARSDGDVSEGGARAGEDCEDSSMHAQGEREDDAKEADDSRKENSGHSKVHASSVREKDKRNKSMENTHCGEGGRRDRGAIQGDELKRTGKRVMGQGNRTGEPVGSHTRTNTKLTLDHACGDAARAILVSSLPSGPIRYREDHPASDRLVNERSMTRENEDSGMVETDNKRKDGEAEEKKESERRGTVTATQRSSATPREPARADRCEEGKLVEREEEREMPGRHFDVYASDHEQYGNRHENSTPRRRGFFDSDSDEEIGFPGDCPNTSQRQRSRGKSVRESMYGGARNQETSDEFTRKVSSAAETAFEGAMAGARRGKEKRRETGATEEGTGMKEMWRSSCAEGLKEVDVYTLASILRTRGKPVAVPRMTYSAEENDNRVEGVLFLDERPIKNWLKFYGDRGRVYGVYRDGTFLYSLEWKRNKHWGLLTRSSYGEQRPRT
ncbi:hypothetical protein CSUI_010724 [Cystoisospora suis]|uniref:J domain-containing protein n=1 Tax=Cystoisospora suis TaxID=483139 RepID=A0A2C6KG64_9APIC|nr:hypothetical protein CSUI_010724 [Cystoisospora suis]